MTDAAATGPSMLMAADVCCPAPCALAMNAALVKPSFPVPSSVTGPDGVSAPCLLLNVIQSAAESAPGPAALAVAMASCPLDGSSESGVCADTAPCLALNVAKSDAASAPLTVALAVSMVKSAPATCSEPCGLSASCLVAASSAVSKYAGSCAPSCAALPACIAYGALATCSRGLSVSWFTAISR